MSRVKKHLNGKATSNGHANGVTPKPPRWKPLPEKVDVLTHVFTYAKMLHADVYNYTHKVSATLYGHPKVGKFHFGYSSGYPTDRVRNAVLKAAKENGHHFILMLDDDMLPDMGQHREHYDPQAVSFMPSALEFAIAHDGPCLVGAPYVAGPPFQEVVVMKNREYIPGMADGLGKRLDKYTRDEAAMMKGKGIQRVAALPTGCLLVDLRALDVLPPPWFSYEYEDEPHNTKLASTEDVVFTRNLDWLGVPSYCHWDAWAGHIKQHVSAPPVLSPVNDLPDSIHKAIFQRGWKPADVKPVTV